MYELLKSLAKICFSSSFLRKNEHALRTIIALRYRGSNYTCNLCKYSLRRFIKLENGDLLCPKCGSLPRNRRLWDIIKDELEGKSILHFSPATSLKKQIETIVTKQYITTDFEDEFEADKQYDIKSIPEPDESIDIIICYHVLEHIENDLKAMSELYRIIKPNGVCYIQTPFRAGDILEEDRIMTKKERLKLFGQEDHIRVYSIDGLCERLIDVKFRVIIREMESNTYNESGFNQQENIIICYK